MDFTTGLPKVQGIDCIYVVVDRLTKYAHFYAITSEFKAPQVADLFFREVFRLHGLPRNIVSDRDSKFISLFWQELFRLAHIELTPESNRRCLVNLHTHLTITIRKKSQNLL
jgi:hypothetical protein